MSETGRRSHNFGRAPRVVGGLLASLAIVGGPLSGCGSTARPSLPKTHRSHSSGGETEHRVGAKVTRDNESVLMFRTTPPLLSMVNILVCEDGRLNLSTAREYPDANGGFTEDFSLHQYAHSPYCDGNYLTAKGLSFEPPPLPLEANHHNKLLLNA